MSLEEPKARIKQPSEETLGGDSTLVMPREEQIIDRQHHSLCRPQWIPPAISPTRLCGVLGLERVAIGHAGKNRRLIVRSPAINGIPLLGIMFLDLANSADFPANVFNEIPVPAFAAVLMALGATFALVMAIIALLDARRSFLAVRQLRRERQALLKRAKDANDESEKGQSPAQVPSLSSFLHLNRRDIGTELFERLFMETFMGFAAFLVSIGTYMAIAGDDPAVFDASNLLSGYIGNSPAAFYGILNAIWSIAMIVRARRLKSAARTLNCALLRPRVELLRRAQMIQIHASLSIISCLPSGALGMVTPTQWQPYPVMAVLGLVFAYTTVLFRRRIGYIRPPLSDVAADITHGDLREELYILFELRNRTLAIEGSAAEATDSSWDREQVQAAMSEIVLCGLFEEFCIKFLKGGDDTLLSVLLSEDKQDITRADVIQAADKIYGTDKEHNSRIYEELGQICRSCLQRKKVLQGISMRTRFLLELLGSHLLSSPPDD